MKCSLKIPKVTCSQKWAAYLFITPFVLIFIGDHIFSIRPIYTFGLDLKDFIATWIAIFGVFGVIYNIGQNQKRISQQEVQIKGQNKQIDLQAKSERNARFAKGVELLGNSKESTRIGGAYSLYFLVNEFSDIYTNIGLNILTSHVKTITGNKRYQNTYKKKPSNEIQTILSLLFKEQKGQLLFKNCRADLCNAYLKGANLENAELSHADLRRINLTGADLSNANLAMANLSFAQLNNAIVDNADFSYSIIYKVNKSSFNSEKAMRFDLAIPEGNTAFITQKPPHPHEQNGHTKH